MLACTDCDCGEQSFWNVGNDDSDEEDNSVEPHVAEYEGDDEERESEEDSDACDEVYEVFDLTRYRRLSNLKPRRQVSDTTHHRPVTGEDHHSPARTWQPISRHFKGRPLLLKIQRNKGQFCSINIIVTA